MALMSMKSHNLADDSSFAIVPTVTHGLLEFGWSASATHNLLTAHVIRASQFLCGCLMAQWLSSIIFKASLRQNTRMQFNFCFDYTGFLKIWMITKINWQVNIWVKTNAVLTVASVDQTCQPMVATSNREAAPGHIARCRRWWRTFSHRCRFHLEWWNCEMSETVTVSWSVEQSDSDQFSYMNWKLSGQ